MPGPYNDAVRTVATVGAIVAGALVLLGSRTAREVLGDVLIVVGSRLAPVPLIGPSEWTPEQMAAGEARLLAELRGLQDRRPVVAVSPVRMPLRVND